MAHDSVNVSTPLCYIARHYATILSNLPTTTAARAAFRCNSHVAGPRCTRVYAPGPDFDPSRKRVTFTRTDMYLPAASKPIAISIGHFVFFARPLHPSTFLRGGNQGHVDFEIFFFSRMQRTGLLMCSYKCYYVRGGIMRIV